MDELVRLIKDFLEFLDVSPAAHATVFVAYGVLAAVTRWGVKLTKKRHIRSALTSVLEGLSNQELRTRK
jgi:hypothetical protein